MIAMHFRFNNIEKLHLAENSRYPFIRISRFSLHSSGRVLAYDTNAL